VTALQVIAGQISSAWVVDIIKFIYYQQIFSAVETENLDNFLTVNFNY